MHNHEVIVCCFMSGAPRNLEIISLTYPLYKKQMISFPWKIWITRDKRVFVEGPLPQRIPRRYHIRHVGLHQEFEWLNWQCPTKFYPLNYTIKGIRNFQEIDYLNSNYPTNLPVLLSLNRNSWILKKSLYLEPMTLKITLSLFNSTTLIQHA